MKRTIASLLAGTAVVLSTAGACGPGGGEEDGGEGGPGVTQQDGEGGGDEGGDD